MEQSVELGDLRMLDLSTTFAGTCRYDGDCVPVLVVRARTAKLMFTNRLMWMLLDAVGQWEVDDSWLKRVTVDLQRMQW